MIPRSLLISACSLDNVPDYLFWLGAGALAGATIVGINSTYRGSELARLIDHTDCQVLVTEDRHRPLLDGLSLNIPASRVLQIDEHRLPGGTSYGSPCPGV